MSTAANVPILFTNVKLILTNPRLALTNRRGKYHPFYYLYCMKNHLSLNYDRFVILVWIFLGFSFYLQYSLQTGSIVEAGLLSLSIVLTAYPFTTYLSKELLQKAMHKRKMSGFILKYILFSVIYAIILASVFRLFLYFETIGYFPMSRLFSPTDSFYFDYFMGPFFSATFLNLGFCGLRFYQENLRLQQVLADSQLQILQAQINPHFMFNILNHIHILMQEDVDKASRLLIQYADILRYQLYNGAHEYSSLEQEIQFLKNYIDVEKIRWEENVSVHCTWTTENEMKEIPPLLLITFVENAFKHVARSTSEQGYINIGFRQQGDELRFEVENSKSTLHVFPKKDSGIGLENIKKRLDILYPGKYGLAIRETNAVYCATLVITI